MNKNKKIVILVVIAIIILLTFGFLIIRNKKYSQEANISISDYKYFVLYNNEDKVGVIDREGKEIIPPKYTDIYIPNPLKDVFICFNGEERYIVNSNDEEIFTDYQDVSGLVTSEDSLLVLENNVLKYKKNELYGLINLDGKMLTEPIYEEVSSLKNRPGRILVKKDDRYGVLDTNGKVVVPVLYYSIIGDEYCEEENGYQNTGFIVSNKSKTGILYGYYNSNGRKILETKYESISRILEYNDNSTYLIVMSNGKKGVLRNGRKLIDLNYQDVMYSRNSKIFIVNKNGKYGFFAKNGKEILEPKYEAYEIAGEYISVKENDKNVLYDINGNYIDQKNYKSILEVGNSSYFIAISEKDNSYSILSKDVNIENNYKNISYLFDNLFTFTNQEGKCGIIDATKGEVIDAKYDLILKVDGIDAIEARENDGTATIYSRDLQEICTMSGAIVENINKNFAVVYNQTERVYIDLYGNTVENTKVYPNDKLYAFNKDEKWGFINKEGKAIIEPKYDMVTELNEYGFAGIYKDGRWGVINEEGKVIVEPIYEINSYYLPKFIGKYMYEQTETIHCIDLSKN